MKQIGSDHFPVYVNLYLDSSAQKLHDEPEADHEEKQRADDKIDEGDPR